MPPSLQGQRWQPDNGMLVLGHGWAPSEESCPQNNARALNEASPQPILPLPFSPGDVMGPTLNHLSNLLRLPFGCGEQNMIHFAPNVFVLKYLQKTRQLSPEVERETTDHLVQGTGVQ